jgi:hypothetical protein
MKIEIIKQFRLLEVGKQLNVDREWASNLIEKGFAKSLEVVEEVEKTEKSPVEKPKKEKLIKEK